MAQARDYAAQQLYKGVALIARNFAQLLSLHAAGNELFQIGVACVVNSIRAEHWTGEVAEGGCHSGNSPACSASLSSNPLRFITNRGHQCRRGEEEAPEQNISCRQIAGLGVTATVWRTARLSGGTMTKHLSSPLTKIESTHFLKYENLSFLLKTRV